MCLLLLISSAYSSSSSQTFPVYLFTASGARLSVGLMMRVINRASDCA